MAKEHSQSPEIDLDRTDRLPILDGTLFDHDVADDAVPLDHTAVLAGPPAAAAHNFPSDFVRPSGVDLPSLAESVRSVEERIARQNAEYDALTRAYERLRDTEAAATARAGALAADLASARTALESEHGRSRDLERMLADRSSAIESSRSRVEEALRESERHQGESRTLKDSLAARDSTIAQVLHSLGERDAQLAALQAEHARILPALEATSKSSTQLDADLRNARAQADARAAELQASRQALAALNVQLERGESELQAARSELGAAQMQASSYLEVLRTREWRRGFDQNLFRELDAQVGAANAGHGALESERDRLQTQAAALESKIAAQGAAIDKLQAGAAANAATLAQQADALKHAEETRTRLAAQMADADSEIMHLTEQLAARDRALVAAGERGTGDALKVAELQEAAHLRQAEHETQMAQLRGEQAAQIERLQSEAETHEQEMAVLMAHLQEARRPIQSIEADVKRLTEELAAKSAAQAASEEENRTLRATLERTRGALEEREFLIRRLERSESNNANVLGRIQTSIERLGSVPVAPSAGAAAAPMPDWSAELIRIDGEQPVTHVLSRRTRIGRAAGCELQIEAGSVSRHHALILVGAREALIEDLNSTNGVLVNGRKVSRQQLADGDAVTIGEIQFRYMARPLQRAPDQNPPAPTA
jgi:chromosome segregation ATPase